LYFFTSRGFYLAVLRPDADVTIRATVPGDLEALRDQYMPPLAVHVLEGKPVGVISRMAFEAGMAKAVADLAPNFAQKILKDSGPPRLLVFRKIQELLQAAPAEMEKERKRIEYEAEMAQRQQSLPFDKPEKK
jgi:hypothetical protein